MVPLELRGERNAEPKAKELLARVGSVIAWTIIHHSFPAVSNSVWQ